MNKTNTVRNWLYKTHTHTKDAVAYYQKDNEYNDEHVIQNFKGLSQEIMETSEY